MGRRRERCRRGLFTDAAAATAAGDSDVEWRLGAVILCALVCRLASSRHAAASMQASDSMYSSRRQAALAFRWHYRCLTTADVQSNLLVDGGSIWSQWTCRWPSTANGRSLGGPVRPDILAQGRHLGCKVGSTIESMKQLETRKTRVTALWTMAEAIYPALTQ